MRPYFKSMMLLRFIPIIILLCPACNFNPNEKVVPKWEMEVLGPLVKADLNIQNIAELEDLHAKAELRLSDFGFNTPVVPGNVGSPVNIPTIPNLLDITDAFAQGKFESGDLYFTINNQWDVNIRQGTRFILKTSAGELYNHELTRTVDKNSGTYVTPIKSLAGDSISTSALSLEVRNFTTNGGAVTNPNNKLTIEVFFNNVKIKSILVNTTENFSTIVDTTDFSINGSTIKSESVAGELRAYITNNFPINFQLQVYFLDANRNVRDSLFTGFQSLNGNSAEQKFSIPLNAEKINNLNNSQFARLMWKANVNSTFTIPNSLYLKTQIVGDLKVKLDEEE